MQKEAGLSEVNFSTFAEFIREMPHILFDNGIFDRERYLFRGHGSSDFELESSFDRRFASLGPAERLARYGEFLTFLRAEFERIGEGSLTDGEILGLAQHYGTPTRLLDWTSSPLIASYFAFHGCISSNQRIRQVCVWALDRAIAYTWSEFGVDVIRLERGHNARADRQLGFATNLKTPNRTLEEFVEQMGLSQPALWKFNIEASDARAAFSFLDACNTRATELFGGTEGAARTALERLVLRDGAQP